jgi:hypothetical protein
MTATSDRTVIAEVTATIVIVGGGIALASSGDLCLPGADVHPLWIPVLLFAARYGMRGMFMAAALATLALATVSLAEHGTLAELTARGSSPYDMIALVAATLVAWTAGMRDGRLTHALNDRHELDRKLKASNETTSALHDVVRTLRERLDRLDMSISVWRAIAGRLVHGPFDEAATAALELACIRSGASAGLVQRCIGAGNRLKTVATLGHLPDARSDISSDRTVQNAIAYRRPALRTDLKDATPDDSDLAVVITDPVTGELLGVLALRDVPTGEVPEARLAAAQVRDVELVANWLADAFPRPQMRAGNRAC